MSHRTPAQLARCLRSVPADCRPRTTVVENGSCAESVARVRREHPWARLVEEQENAGFGAAVDVGVRHGRSPVVLVLNADTELGPDTAAELSRYLGEHPRCAIVGPRVVGDDGRLQPSCFPWPSPLDYLLAELRVYEGIRRLLPRPSSALRLWDHGRARTVPWVLGCAFAMRRSAYLDVGGFDPRFFLYFEEVDLCWRLRRAGWTTDFTPDARITHTGGSSTAAARSTSKIHFHESMDRWYRLHRPDRLRRLRWAVAASLPPLAGKAMLTTLLPGSTRRESSRSDLQAWREIARRTAVDRRR